MFTSFRKTACTVALGCVAMGSLATGAGQAIGSDRPSADTRGVAMEPAYDEIWEVRYCRRGTDDPWQVVKFEGETAELRANEFCKRLERDGYEYRMERPAIATISE